MIEILAEMAANVWQLVVADGDHVTPGAELVILESMKMEIPVEATAAGVVTLAVTEGGSVQEGDLIATIEP